MTCTELTAAISVELVSAAPVASNSPASSRQGSAEGNSKTSANTKRTISRWTPRELARPPPLSNSTSLKARCPGGPLRRQPGGGLRGYTKWEMMTVSTVLFIFNRLPAGVINQKGRDPGSMLSVVPTLNQRVGDRWYSNGCFTNRLLTVPEHLSCTRN
jgi:hypothetical protein